MKPILNSILLLTILFLPFFGKAQKEDREQRFNFDYAARRVVTGLDSSGVDTILTAYYHYDNGIGTRATKLILWQEGGECFAQALCIRKKGRYKEIGPEKLSSDSIFEFFFSHRVDTVTSHPRVDYWLSHNYGYSIDFKYGTGKYTAYLRDENRAAHPTHPKSQWIALIDRVGSRCYRKR